MRTGKGRRWAALLLCLAMMFSTIGSASPADSAEPSAGLCEHHPEHTTECGYIAPSAGSPCRHVHDESCGYAEAVAETPCDMNCTDTDGDGVIDHAEGCAYTPGSAGSPCGHVHDESCGYAEATEGSPCQFVCDICNAAPDATEAPADSPAPEEPSDTLAPTETPAPAETPAPIGDPGMEGPGLDEPAADGDIMLTALTDPVVTVKKSGDVADPGTGIESNTPCEMEHNQVYQLNVTANYSGVTNGKVKITVAPGLKINSYYQDTSATIDAVKATHSNPEITNYTPYNSATDTLEYEISDAATAISLDVTLAVDTVLWPKTDGWTIDNAIQVEFTGDGESAVTRTANVTVKYGAETSPSWNQLYSSDSNNSVPQNANKPFRMKIFQVSPNLHGSPLGFYYKKLEVTIPLPKVNGQEVYASYDHVDCSQPPTPVTNGDHTVTFTWNNIYVPAGSAFSFTPYFKWDSQQTAGATVNFSVPGSFKATATPYSGADVSFSINISGGTSQAFTVRGDVAVNFNTGGARTGDVSIFNNGSTDQVYQLGQFQVRNDGFGATGALNLQFSFDQTNAHVIAQGIPVGSQSGKVTSIKYKTNIQTSDVTETISDSNYRNTDNNRSYMLMAPAGEWFTQITAVIEGLPAQTVCYNPSAGLSPNNGAVTYGTLVNNNTGDFPATLTITGDNVQSPGSVTGQYTSNIVNTNKAATQMSVTSGAPFTFGGEATNTVQLGTSEDDRTISYSAVISATTYPYANNQVVERPVIYLRLPDTITVSADDVKLSSVQTGGAENQVTAIDSSHYTFSEEASRGGAGHHVYKIEFNAGDYAGAIGCFNKQLGENQLQLEFEMLADVGIGDVTLKMCETVFVGYADGTPIKASGSLASSQQADKFNVDGDEQTDTEFFSTMTDVDANRLTILAPRIGLTFNSYAKLSDETEYSNYKAPDINPEGLEGKDDIMYLTEDGQTIDFQFTAENKTGAALSISSTELGNEDFYYFIPVPKIGNFWDEAHRHIQDSEFQLDMELTGPVVITETGTDSDNRDLVCVQYSTRAGSTDFNSTDRTTIEDLYKDAPESGNWADVKMIRISVSPEAAGRSFPVNYKATFTIHYSFKLETGELVGYAVEFGPCGNTRYLRNGEGESGHTPTQRVRAELQTGRIAGRVFIDEDYSGSYTGEKDYFIEFKDSADPETGGGAFLDSDKDGEQDDGEIGVTMDLYAQDASGDVKHYARKPVAEDEAFKNTYEIPSLRAESYTLYIGNPNYTEGKAGEYSLRFIDLAAETGEGSRGGSDKLAPASSYGAGYKEATTAAGITISAADVTANRMRDIGLQRPHEVTFTVTYEDDHGAPPEKASQTVYVWHGETATAPEIKLADDFRLKVDGSTTWTTTDGQATYGQPITSTTREITYTATAVRIPHNVIYDPNGATVNPGSMPDPTQGVNGETVTLDTDHTPSRSDRPGVVFIGWTTEKKEDIVSKGDSRATKKTLGCVDSVPMGAEDTTVYALWGYDTNGNGTADVLEGRYTLTYNPNGGKDGTPAEVTNLLFNETVTFADSVTVNPTHDPDEGTTVLFVGWSESQAEIYGKGDYNNRAEIKRSLKTSVTMESADKTVYAVWAYDENNNKTPDYEEDTHYGVQYDTNGGDIPAELTAAQNTYYLPEMKVTLWQPKSTWTKAPQAVFVGWCATDLGETPLASKPSADIITEVTTPAAGGESPSVTVYAVWAEDKNGNGLADYSEAQITIQYDKNSGDGAGDFSDMTGLVRGAAYPLADGKGLKRNDPDHPEHPAVFVGWSTEKQDIVPETLKGTVDDLKLVGSSYTIPGDAGSLVTLYAVYGADNNGNGQPDYDESARHVAYYPNGGQKKDGSPTDDATPFYVCNHHHVAEETADLETADALKVLIERPGAVLIGWSVSPQEVFGGTADAKKAAEAILITEIEIPAEEGTNAKVYAVWAADENGNHEADYNDPHYSQWYYYNAALTDWSPSSEREELNTEDAPRSTVDGNPSEVDKIVYENSTLPASLTDILKDTCIDLPAPVLKARTDLAADGTELHHYVQLGWSGFCHPAATSRTQANLWLIESLDDDLGTPGLQRKIVGSMFQYNFAVWALDENHNGTADFDESPYTLHYDLNGGAGKVPEDEDYLPGEKVELDGTSAPLRTQAIFLGWSLEKHDPATSKADAEAWKIDSVTLPKESAQPGKNVVTVYALWAANENAAGDEPDSVTPDYEERHSLTFDPNPMSGGAVSGMPETLTQEYDYGAEVPVPEPTHSDVDGKHVLFVGWSTEKTGLTRAGGSTVYRAGDKVKIGAYDLTLYAQWAFEQTPPAETDAPGRSGSIPWTGDGGHPGIWAALLGLFSAASAGLVLAYKKRRRPDR